MIDRQVDAGDRYASVPLSLLTDRRLTDTDVRVIAILLTKTANWRVSSTQVANELGISPKTVRRSLDRLEAAGYAAAVIRETEKKRWRSDFRIAATTAKSGQDWTKLSSPTLDKIDRSKLSSPAQPDKTVQSETTTLDKTVQSTETALDSSDPPTGQNCPVDRTKLSSQTGQNCPTTESSTESSKTESSKTESRNYRNPETAGTGLADKSSWTMAEIDAMSKDDVDRLMKEDSARGAAFFALYTNRIKIDIDPVTAPPQRKPVFFRGGQDNSEFLRRARSAA